MKKLVNIFITVVFLVSFIGIRINKHYSHGKLYSVALFEKAAVCEEMKNVSSPQSGDPSPVHNCCENHTQTLKITDAFVTERFSVPEVTSFNLCSVIVINFNNTPALPLFSTNTNTRFYQPIKPVDFPSVYGIFLC